MKFPYSSKFDPLTAIIVVQTGDKDFQFKKYTFVGGSPRNVSTFCSFAKKKFPLAIHINFYYRKTGEFKDRIELE